MVIIFASCHRSPLYKYPAASSLHTYDPKKDTLVMQEKEMRGVWLTTVNNADWPKKGSNVTAQKKQLINLLDLCDSLNINTIVMQIRPTADAFYPSKLEPWSYYLTGIQGKDPGYDPLAFAIEETHKRKMKFHAWLNPYRIGWDSIPLAPNHIAVKNPNWIIKYKRNQYFDPGIPEVRVHLNAVIADIIKKYPVDGIHFDDYFYPFGSKSENPFVFNDSLTFVKYGLGKDITSWRTANVDTMVRQAWETVKTTNKNVIFSISPAGRRENSVALYADPFTWLENKWVDFLVPQVYWEFGHAIADFGKVTDFWDTNTFGIPMIVGIPAYRYKTSTAFSDPQMIVRQIDYTRSKTNMRGHFYFRTENLANVSLKEKLMPLYHYKSVPPDLNNYAYKKVLEAPMIKNDGNKIKWKKLPEATDYAIYILEKDNPNSKTIVAKCAAIISKNQIKVQKGKSYFITALNYNTDVESRPSNILTIR